MKKFSLAAWERTMHRYLKDAEFLGTKNTNPLVRWQDRNSGPLKMCPHNGCKGAFTALGLTRHMRSCKTKTVAQRMARK